MKNCKRCKAKLSGIMIFYPTLCLNCVADLDNADKEKLNKYKKSLDNNKFIS